MARRFAPYLDAMDGSYMAVSTTRGAWDGMPTVLGPPAEGEAGPKSIRRSISTTARRRIGEAQWQQGKMMLGHVPHAISCIYAIPDSANLGLALAATEAIIDKIEALCPGAFGAAAA